MNGSDLIALCIPSEDDYVSLSKGNLKVSKICNLNFDLSRPLKKMTLGFYVSAADMENTNILPHKGAIETSPIYGNYAAQLTVKGSGLNLKATVTMIAYHTHQHAYLVSAEVIIDPIFKNAPSVSFSKEVAKEENKKDNQFKYIDIE